MKYEIRNQEDNKKLHELIHQSLDEINQIVVKHIEEVKGLGFSKSSIDIATSLFANYISGIEDYRTFLWYIVEKVIVTEEIYNDQKTH